MRNKAKREGPEFVIRDGQTVAVILDIDQYQQMLERLEDVADMKVLEKMRKKPLRFRKLNEFLKEHHPGV